MINKIKDFLKNRFARNRSQDLNDQDSESKSDYIEETDETPPGEPDFSQDDGIDYAATTSTNNSLKTSLTSIRDVTRRFQRQLKLPEWKRPEFKGGAGGGPTLSPNLSRLSEKFLSRESRESIHQISLVLLICSMTYTLGKITALVLKGKPTAETRRYSVNIPLDKEFQPGTLAQVRSINIFRTNTGLDKKKKVDTKCEEAQGTSNLPIKLVNTVVLQDSVKSLASVQVRGGRELQEVRVGDEIDNLAKIFRISRLELLIKNLESGACESIGTPEARDRSRPLTAMTPGQSRAYKAAKKIPGIENVGNKFTIQKNLLEEKLKDISQVLDDALAIKIQNPDGSLSFKMTQMDPEGIFPFLGLQEGDIITSINGKPIYDMNEVMSMFARIKNLDQLQLGIKREGAESVQDYSIKK